MDQRWSAPLLNGERALDAEKIGGTGTFRPLNGPMAGASGGQIQASFFDNPASSLHGRLATLAIVRADGSVATTIMPHNATMARPTPPIPSGPLRILRPRRNTSRGRCSPSVSAKRRWIISRRASGQTAGRPWTGSWCRMLRAARISCRDNWIARHSVRNHAD